MLWKTVRVFISSTFRDMHAERDYLVHDVFLELKERCAKRRLHLIDVDLRWGVTEEEEKQGKVLEICLDEIERCRPFFIGLLGERYGWTPPKYDVRDDEEYHWVKELEQSESRHSVTALEIYHGVLRNPSMQTRAFFYFRDPSFLKDPLFLNEVPDEKQNDFQPESEDAARKLKALKDEIKEHCPVFENYPCEYGGLDEKGQVKLTYPEAFRKRVLEELWEAIELEHPEDETPLDDVEIERSYHEAFIEGRSQRFIGRTDVLAQLTAFADGEAEYTRVVTGKPGCGKSAVLANFTREHSANHPKTFVLAHFIGVSPGSTDIRRTLLRLCRELARQFNIQDEIPTDYYELRQTFVKFLEHATTQGKVLLVLDALNQLDESHYAHALDWLPQSLPEGLKIIVSTIDDSDCLEALRRRSPAAREVVVGALAEEERREIVRQTLKTYRKRLDERPENDQMGLLLRKHESDNPLYLTVACEEMRVFGEFERVTKRIEALPGEVESLFEQVLERIEDDHERVEPTKGKERVKTALSLLECSRHGLLESEMLELLARDGEDHLPPALWARLYRGLKFYLRPSGSDEGAGESGEGLLDFFHRQLARAVRQKYLKDEGAEVATHQRLAKYFRRKADPSDNQTWSGNYPRALSKLSHHLLSGKLHNELFELARDESFLRSQTAAFPDDPELQLQTLQHAITGAAEIDDAALMSEFVLAHAWSVATFSSESPLEVLRKGNLERAWKLVDLNSVELRGLWYLLMAWELADRGKPEEARATTQRLVNTQLTKLVGSIGRQAALLIAETAAFSKESFILLQDKLLHDEDRGRLCSYLMSTGDFERSLETAKHGTLRQDELLSAIAIEQAKFGRFPEAIETAHMLGIHGKDSTLTKIAIEQVKAFQFQQALQTSTSAEARQATALALIGLGQYQRGIETAELIPDDCGKAEAWGAIAAKLAQAGKAQLSEEIFRRAIESVELTYYQTDALKAIASCLAEAGQRDRSLELFRRAVGLASSIELEWYREEALSGIAALMAGSGFIAESVDLARLVDSVTLRNDMLRSMAIGLAKTRRWQEAVDLAGMDFASDFKIEMLVVIAVEMSKAGNFESALALVTDKDLAKRGSSDGICAIAIELAKSSLPLKAIETARTIASASTRTKALIAIAAEFAKPEATELCITTLREAFETAASIFGSRTREDAVLTIAWEAAKAGYGEFSRNILAQNIEGFKPVDQFCHKAEALGVIASGLAKAGFSDLSEEVFQRAVKTTDMISAAYDQASAFCAVASELAEAGQNKLSRLVFKRAIETAGSIDDNKEKSRVLLAAASRLAEHGQLDLAMEATPSNDWIHAGLIEIVVSQMVRAGQFSAAIEKANSINFIHQRIAALNVIAFEAAKAGQRQLSDSAFQQAISKAAQMGIPCQRANLLTGIGATLIKSDRRPWAGELLTEATEVVVNAQTFPWEQAESLALIALEWANADKREVSDETFARAASLPTRWFKVNEEFNESGERASLTMVNALARAGKFQMAKDAAGMIYVEALRAEALGLVAAEEARAGFSQCSILTTQQIITDRDRHLVVVAAALANAKDRIGFKKLLIPCADYINASYRLCGILAGLYPQQAVAVAQVVLREP